VWVRDGVSTASNVPVIMSGIGSALPSAAEGGSLYMWLCVGDYFELIERGRKVGVGKGV
jgi:hypothetical protein